MVESLDSQPRTKAHSVAGSRPAAAAGHSPSPKSPPRPCASESSSGLLKALRRIVELTQPETGITSPGWPGAAPSPPCRATRTTCRSPGMTQAARLHPAARPPGRSITGMMDSIIIIMIEMLSTQAWCCSDRQARSESASRGQAHAIAS